MAGDTASGCLGLDAAKQYYVYDFWNDTLVGKYPGSKRFEQTLRPGEARMMSIHEAVAHPQFLSTDRHLMQGLIDLPGCDWDAEKHQLRGVANVVGGEAYRVIVATNGYRPVAATVDETIETDIAKSGLAAVKSMARLQNLPSPLGRGAGGEGLRGEHRGESGISGLTGPRPNPLPTMLRTVPGEGPVRQDLGTNSGIPTVVELILQRSTNGPVAWTMTFNTP